MKRLHKPVIEPLESRRLYAAVLLSHNVLVIEGSSATNTITVGLTADQQSVTATIDFTTNKGPQQVTGTFAVAGIHGVFIRGGPRADLITVDQTNGSFSLPTGVIAGNGNDTVYGGDEADDFSGGVGDDYINSGGGMNRVEGDGGNDTLLGGDGVNILVGGPGNDSLTGGVGNDTLFGEGGRDTLIGNGGNDAIRGGPGHDCEFGGAGDDTLFDVSGPDTLMGGDGQNTFIVRRIRANPVNDYVKGKDILKRIPPPSEDGFLDGILKGVLFPYY